MRTIQASGEVLGKAAAANEALLESAVRCNPAIRRRFNDGPEASETAATDNVGDPGAGVREDAADSAPLADKCVRAGVAGTISFD